MNATSRPGRGRELVIVTGPSGSGRSTAIGAFEDLGFEAIDNLPLSLLPRLFAGPPLPRPVVVGIDPRNREFDVARLAAHLGEVAIATRSEPVLLYLDCDAATLVRRYSETRRRHPLSPDQTPLIGIGRETALLAPLRARADVLIDTSSLSPHELRAEVARQFGLEAGAEGGVGVLAVSLHSFAYKRGLPRGIDMAMDVRFLRNPHWVPGLRDLDGRDPEVVEHVLRDPTYAPFLGRLVDLLRFLLPAYRREGKSYFGLGIGCTGGKHRSVVVVEALAKTLAADGWQVSIRHRDVALARSEPAGGLEVGSA